MPQFLSRIPFSALLITAVIIAISISNGSFVFWNQQQIALIEVAFSLFVLWGEKFKQIPWSPGYLWAPLWLVLVAVSTFLAMQHLESSANRSRFFQEGFHLLFGWSVWRLACREKTTEMIANAVATGIIIGALINLISIILRWNNLFDPRTAGWTTGLPLFVNIRHLGYLISAAVVAQVFIFLRCEERKAVVISFIGLILLTAFLFWTGGRAVIGGVFVASSVMFFLAKSSWQKTLWIILALPLAAALAQYFAVADGSLGLFRAIDRSTQAQALDGFLSGRWTVWTDAWRRILEQPWLGWGADGYVAIRPPYAIQGGILHPHNVFVQCLVEWGFLGTGVFIILFLQFLKPIIQNLWRMRSQQNYDPALLLGGALAGNLLLLSLTEGIFYHGIGTSLLALSCGLALSARARSL